MSLQLIIIMLRKATTVPMSPQNLEDGIKIIKQIAFQHLIYQVLERKLYKLATNKIYYSQKKRKCINLLHI